MKEETPSSPVPFDLVILLEGSNIHSGDIKEVIKNNILPFAKSKETMRLLEDPKIQERTLILLDGFDEIQNPEKKLLPILSGNYKEQFICGYQLKFLIILKLNTGLTPETFSKIS